MAIEEEFCIEIPDSEADKKREEEARHFNKKISLVECLRVFF
jgi:acyl carrier protein